ncbi:TIGR04086 family membrane protein [Orenia marismortui]|uniref:Putative membrane protein (TIGR04086 family) n=1 Tax=Orenia marismortui TaxID=46469 RepID=A0A4R8GSB3_9FIRM|nr:TIGR04086 family membrane protein [Orenia marismortui]TDX45431.1 putative membrane protein (TIGR04086 family) [Orenia marismortui]
MPQSQNDSSAVKVSSILRGLVVSLILLLMGSVVLGIIISLSNAVNNSVSKILFILNYLSVFVGGSVAAYSAGGKGWINGGLVGLIYMLMIILLGSLWNPIIISLSLVSRVVIGFLVSALGGMIGVNVV